MALFKPLVGGRESLKTTELHAGYVYFCDDGSLFFDYKDENDILRRKQINAHDAETLLGATLVDAINDSKKEIPTSKAVFQEILKIKDGIEDIVDEAMSDFDMSEQIEEATKDVRHLIQDVQDNVSKTADILMKNISDHDVAVDAHRNMGWLTSEDVKTSSHVPLNADTLGGHKADYFAKANDLESIRHLSEEKVDADQGAEHAGKVLGIGEDGKVVPVDAPSGGPESNGGNWERIEVMCFGYEHLTEKPSDWDTNNTSYFYKSDNDSKIRPVESWMTFYNGYDYWQYTGEFDSEVAEIVRTSEPDGTPYNFKGVMVCGHIYNTATSGLWCVNAFIGGKHNYTENSVGGVATLPKVDATYPYHFAYKITQEAGVYNLLCFSGSQGDKTTVTGVSNARTSALLHPVTDGNITCIKAGIYAAKQYYGEGDYIEIWGVRA